MLEALEAYYPFGDFGGTGMSDEIFIDPTDHAALVALMDDADSYPMPLSGENEDGENTLTSIDHESVVVLTFQSNGWTRKNIYWRDGYSEELFTRAED